MGTLLCICLNNIFSHYKIQKENKEVLKYNNYFAFFSMFFGGIQNQINTLEILIEDDKQKSIQIELLKQEKMQLISELAAKESLIYGLRT